MKQKTRFKNIGKSVIGAWMADISVSAKQIHIGRSLLKCFC